jgi:hypothetical protein
MLPKDGLILIDDPWGRPDKPIAGDRIYTACLKLCNAAPGYSCQLLMTSQRPYYEQLTDDMKNELRQLNVCVVDINEVGNNLPKTSKARIFKKIVQLRDPKKNKPLCRSNLVNYAARMVGEYDFRAFDINYWASTALLLDSKEALRGSAHWVGKRSITNCIDQLENNHDIRRIILLAFLMRGSLLDEVKNWLNEPSIVAITKIPNGIDSVPKAMWNSFYITKNRNGAQYLDTFHTIVSEELSQYLFKVMKCDQIMDWIYIMLGSKSLSIQIAAIHAIFSLREHFCEKFYSLLGHVLDTILYKRYIEFGAKYEAMRLLLFQIEKDPMPLLVDRFMQVLDTSNWWGRDFSDYQVIFNQCLRLVVRDWEKMPLVLRKKVNDFVEKTHTKYSRSSVTEIMMEMAKRVDVFYDSLLSLVVHSKDIVQIPAVNYLEYIYHNKELSFSCVLEVTSIFSGVLTDADRLMLRISLRNEPFIFKEYQRAELQRALYQSLGL